MDLNNPVVKLCSQGMRAEAEGRMEEARKLFSEAWNVSRDDYDACVAAHFLARHQESYQDMLHWNQEALDRANSVGDERVRDFYPSLYLNMGYSHEMLGNRAEASRYYKLAGERVENLSHDRYGDVVRGGIAAGRKRIDGFEA